MTRPIIEIQQVGKQYKLGQTTESYLSLRDELVRKVKKRGKADQEERMFWALRDVSFDVQAGEAIGLIGRNGAGKSTLLKILSKITPPTEGKVVMRGRAGSLLEVGTGFHPELSGRENIYLNGSILGMSRKEISSKFDEIVQFAEVEKFLDTPVKRYSSGMYVRLAFAVAAHLEPEIMIVDEVLAVGDAQFQRKCLGKMGEIAHGGRTVIFVSHSMPAIEALCTRAVMLKGGAIHAMGEPKDITREYMNELVQYSTLSLVERVDRYGDGVFKAVGLRISGEGTDGAPIIATGGSIRFHLMVKSETVVKEPVLTVMVWDMMGVRLINMNSRMTAFSSGRLDGTEEFTCEIPELPLPAGRYRVDISLRTENGASDVMEGAAFFDVAEGLFFEGSDTAGYAYGKFLVKHSWRRSNASDLANTVITAGRGVD